MYDMCMNCVNIYMINGIWNTRVRKHDLRGSEIKLNCISGWQLTPLRKKG